MHLDREIGLVIGNMALSVFTLNSTGGVVGEERGTAGLGGVVFAL